MNNGHCNECGHCWALSNRTVEEGRAFFCPKCGNRSTHVMCGYNPNATGRLSSIVLRTLARA